VGVGEGKIPTRSIPPSPVTSCQNTTSKRSTSMQNSSGNKASRRGEREEVEKRKKRGGE